MSRTSLPSGRRTGAAWAALVLALAVATVAWLVRARVGVGLLFDDGVYLSLARSLSEGQGYVYANLPCCIPGAKYPPAYPVMLALGLSAGLDAGSPEAFRALNALLWGAAAGGAVLLFADPRSRGSGALLLFRGRTGARPADAGVPPYGGRLPLVPVLAVAAVAFLHPSAMWFVTSLMSEPLFLALAVAALLLGDRPLGVHGGGRRSGAVRTLLAGMLAGLAFTARSLGAFLVAGLVVAALVRRRVREAGWLAAGAALPALPWIVWARVHSGQVPDSIYGHYGSYVGWLARAAIERPVEQLGGAAAVNLPRMAEATAHVWVPGLPWAAGAALGCLVGAAALAGLAPVVRRRPALAVFLILYAAAVLVWPATPERFVLTAMPLAALLVAEAAWEGTARLRRRAGRWPALALAAVLGLVAAHAGARAARGQVAGGWARGLHHAAELYAPIDAWIETHTAVDAIVASGLDTYVYWQTGRKGVPLERFRAEEYGGAVEDPDRLAGELAATLRDFEVDILAAPLHGAKAGRVLEAWVGRHPDAVRSVPDAPPGVALYRLVAGSGTRAPAGDARIPAAAGRLQRPE